MLKTRVVGSSGQWSAPPQTRYSSTNSVPNLQREIDRNGQKYNHIMLQVYNWQAQNNNGCSMCAMFQSQKVGGWPKKNRGRPRNPQSPPGVILTHSNQLSFSLHLVHTGLQLEDLQCCMCHCIVDMPVETSCRNWHALVVALKSKSALHAAMTSTPTYHQHHTEQTTSDTAEKPCPRITIFMKTISIWLQFVYSARVPWLWVHFFSNVQLAVESSNYIIVESQRVVSVLPSVRTSEREAQSEQWTIQRKVIYFGCSFSYCT